ncbi:late embryogenesis abundant protein At5g17165-like [Magnolia sinica]|uniref:late embryogenesis abundant protein At5g17165-like n=1 Tax=Magnolia sinica TaxID=86752 RepID=UPI00265B4DFC|nr:late embryogenesis abundant protein At5g17165-like [Magnolia sinica]
MAANLQRRGFASFGKRFVKGNWIGSSRDPSSPVSAVKRGVHFSVYDKNVDDQVRPTVVPDDVIDPPSDKYWAPHPQTGVFGPPELNGCSGGGRYSPLPIPANGSVLEQQAWFRTVDGVDKDHHA